MNLGLTTLSNVSNIDVVWVDIGLVNFLFMDSDIDSTSVVIFGIALRNLDSDIDIVSVINLCMALPTAVMASDIVIVSAAICGIGCLSTPGVALNPPVNPPVNPVPSVILVVSLIVNGPNSLETRSCIIIDSLRNRFGSLATVPTMDIVDSVILLTVSLILEIKSDINPAYIDLFVILLRISVLHRGPFSKVPSTEPAEFLTVVPLPSFIL